jgi:hypothetical protein
MTTDTARNERHGTRAPVVAVVLAALASLFLLFVGLVDQTHYSASGERTVRSVSLWQARGFRALVVLSIPVLIAVVALIATRASSHPAVPWVAAAALWLWVIAFVAGIGGFYVPAAIAETAAAVTAARRRSSRNEARSEGLERPTF